MYPSPNSNEGSKEKIPTLSSRRKKKLLKSTRDGSKERMASKRREVKKSRRGVKSSRQKPKGGSSEENPKTKDTQTSEEEKSRLKKDPGKMKAQLQVKKFLKSKVKSKRRTMARKMPSNERKASDAEDRSKEEENEKNKDGEKLKSKTFWPVQYSTEHLQSQIDKMIARNLESSLLSVADHVIQFLPNTSGMESCYHLIMHNPTKDYILFQVGSPPVPYLSVKPKIGYLTPDQSCTIFLLFSYRIPRLPDDLTFVYKIGQQRIDAKHLKDLEADVADYTTRRMRKISRQSKFRHFWKVATCFYAGEDGGFSCPGSHFEGKRPQLDNQGKICEVNYNPDEHDDKSENLPSAED